MKNKYNFAVRAAVLALTSSAAFAFNTSVRAQPPPAPLWYNGSGPYRSYRPPPGALHNERDTRIGSGQFSSVYDNFNVTGGGWNVTEVFSNNLVPLGFVVTGATWEIRSGTTLLATGGTLVASGTTAAPHVIGHCDNYYWDWCEYEIKVTGLNVFLPVLPAGEFYWLNVTPIGNLTGHSYARQTSGRNCVGTPCGNDGDSFWNSNFFNIKWKPAAILEPQNDFSMGVNGTATPRS
jgi:hypothetical protein